MTEYPHLYVVSDEIPHSQAAGSILLLRLLERWPSDRLAIYGPKVPDGAKTLRCSYREFAPPMRRVQFTRFAPLVAPLCWALTARIPRPSPTPGNAIVLSVMQSAVYYQAAWSFARKNGLPLALIIHDDPEEIQPVRWWTRPSVQRLNALIYRSAQARFCISPQMCETLEARYGARGEVLYPNRSRNITPRPLELNRTLRRCNRLIVGYAGSMVYGYGEALKSLARVFHSRGATLRIYSRQTPDFRDQPGVEYAGANSPEEVWPRVQAECDAVILPYPANSSDHRQTLYRTHFPSKLPEYLALGMPIIVSGPSHTTGVQWALAHPDACALVLSDCINSWPAVLRRLASDDCFRSDLAHAALAAANKEFHPEKIEAHFTKRLRDVATIANGHTNRDPSAR